MEPLFAAALITAIGATIVGVFNAMSIRGSERHRDSINAVDKITDSALTMIEKLEEEIKELEKKVDELSCENAALKKRVLELETQVNGS